MCRVQKRLHEVHLFGQKVTEREKESDGIRETTTDLCYRYINLKVCFLGFVDKIIWIRKDSISISWF